MARVTLAGALRINFIPIVFRRENSGILFTVTPRPIQFSACTYYFLVDFRVSHFSILAASYLRPNSNGGGGGCLREKAPLPKSPGLPAGYPKTIARQMLSWPRGYRRRWPRLPSRSRFKERRYCQMWQAFKGVLPTGISRAGCPGCLRRRSALISDDSKLRELCLFGREGPVPRPCSEDTEKSRIQLLFLVFPGRGPNCKISGKSRGGSCGGRAGCGRPALPASFNFQLYLTCCKIRLGNN